MWELAEPIGNANGQAGRNYIIKLVRKEIAGEVKIKPRRQPGGAAVRACLLGPSAMS